MKPILPLFLACLLLMPLNPARSGVGDYWINEIMTSNKARTALGENVLFFFGDEPHGKILRQMGEVRTGKKTYALNKSDKEACHWVFLSAMKELKVQALRRGGNAVINIRSFYKRSVSSSSETFKCGAGTMIARVGLIGTIIEMER